MLKQRQELPDTGKLVDPLRKDPAMDSATAPSAPGSRMDAGVSDAISIAALVEEGRILSRYVLGGEETTREILERYARASTVVFQGSPPPGDLAVLRFIRRRPWSLPLLDAAAGLIDPDSLLRKKLLLVVAILEATPAHVETFTPRPSSRVAVMARLAIWGTSSVLKALAGLAILPLARRTP
jgi:hypothetical protein